MAERFTADLLFIVVVLLIAALIGFLTGYLPEKRRCRKLVALKDAEIERLKAMISSLEQEKETLTGRVSGLEKEKTALREDARRMDDEIASLRLTIDRLDKELAALKPGHETQSARAEVNESAEPHEGSSPHVVTETASTVIRKDDLRVVVGIGPVIAGLLINRGISTWKKLSETSPAYLKEILDVDGGDQFRMHNPEHWPLQARLLDKGRLDEFRELQKKLGGSGK
jgi:predicted flap endonuclease-1-like 5' DNA nuclease/cell division protein FtsB